MRGWALFVAGFYEPRPKWAVPYLVRALKDKDYTVRYSAARALGKMGPTAKGTVPALIEALRDQVAIVREDAALALRRMVPDAKVAVPALTEALRSPDTGPFGARARCAAAATLLILDEKTEEVALPVLRAGLGDRTMYVREAAAGALRDVGPAAKAVVPDLLAVFQEHGGAGTDSPSTQLTTSARQALFAVGPAATPALVDALKSKDAHVRFVAAEVLAHVDNPKATEVAVPALLAEATRGNHFNTDSSLAAHALRKIGPAARPALVNALKSKFAVQRVRAARLLIAMEMDRALTDSCAAVAGGVAAAGGAALVRMDVADLRYEVGLDNLATSRTNHVRVGRMTLGVVLPVLRAALTDTDPSARDEASRVLQRLGPAAKDAIPELLGLLRDEDLQNGDPPPAAAALRAIGPAAESALADALKSGDTRLRFVAAQLLVQVDRKKHVEAALPALRAALKDESRRFGGDKVLEEAARFLSGLGPAAEGAVPELIELLAKPHVDKYVDMALGSIGPAAEAALLDAARSSPDPRVRKEAAVILRQYYPAAAKKLP